MMQQTAHTFDDHKKQVEKMIIETIVTALENNKLTELQLSPIADYILERIDVIQNHTQLVAFVAELALKWPVFRNIEDIEKGEEKRLSEDRAASSMLQMIKNGKSKQAISYAKSLI